MSEMTEVSDQDPKQIAGRFRKGESGNPGGRPKIALAWKERCRKFLEDEGGWDRLVSMAKSPIDGGDAFPALKLMAEYAYGKPQQHVDLTASGPIIKAYIGVDLDKV